MTRFYEKLDIEYEYKDLYEQLTLIGEGSHETSPKGRIFTAVDGYLDVKLKEGEYELIWTNCEDRHLLLKGKAYYGKVKSDNSIYFLLQSALMMNIITCDIERRKAAWFLRDKVRQLYKIKRAKYEQPTLGN